MKIECLYAKSYIERELYLLLIEGKETSVYASSGLNVGRKGRILPFAGLNTENHFSSPTLGYIYKEWYFNGIYHSHKKQPQSYGQGVAKALLEIEEFLLPFKPPYIPCANIKTYAQLLSIATEINKEMEELSAPFKPFDWSTLVT